MAAAVLRLAGWHKKPYDVLFDPMCGSGTLIIEALHMRLKHAAGLNLKLLSKAFKGHSFEAWHALQSQALETYEKACQHAVMPQIIAFDADIQALRATHTNCIAAGLKPYLLHTQLEERSIAEWPPELKNHHWQNALVVTNPPYGERLGDKGSIKALYQGLGYRLGTTCLGADVVVLAAHVEHADTLYLKDPQTQRLMNGNLPIYARFGQIQAPKREHSLLHTWHSQAVEVDEAQDFANRLQKNMQQFKKWAQKEGIFSARVYDADLPEYNLAIDVYGAWVHVQEYAPPKSIDPTKAKQRLSHALHALRVVLQVPREKVFIKTRERQKGQQQYEKEGHAGKRYVVQEHNAFFYVNFTDYLDTGLFLDHRPMRMRIAQASPNKHVLNLFAYTCTASVHAALAGAATVTSVDLSKTYLEWGKGNFALNGLTVDHPDHKHQFVAADTFEWLKDVHDEFDVIYIDPPTFSNSKKFFGTFDVQRDHVSLLKRAMNRLSSDGILFFSNNYRRFDLDEEILALYDVVCITEQTIDLDFQRNQKIHQAWEIRHRQE